MISKIPSSSAIQEIHDSQCGTISGTLLTLSCYVLSLKAAKVLVNETVANMNRTFDNTQRGSSFVIWLSNRVQANGPIFPLTLAISDD